MVYIYIYFLFSSARWLKHCSLAWTRSRRGGNWKGRIDSGIRKKHTPLEVGEGFDSRVNVLIEWGWGGGGSHALGHTHLYFRRRKRDTRWERAASHAAVVLIEESPADCASLPTRRRASDGAGARREGGVARQRGVGGREGALDWTVDAAWAALDEQNVDELGSNSAEEDGEKRSRDDGMS